ncbi:unnamed protein product [Lactuca virosa]|uniref:tRNA-specific 2-thiouridylase MnmA-like C-terminal domain-containing protein n=1 Tax=Lactuca virosa TaxID=75947 RepID=A0AAU9PXZ2_9ASTR|nr:unnamed protein product [Lactuca virosa]
MLRMPETEMSWRCKMPTTGISCCEPSIIGVWCKNDMKMTLHASKLYCFCKLKSVINTAQKLDEMMLKTTTTALFHPTTKLYYLPLKAFVSHSLHKPQRLINRQSYPQADRTILSINTPRSLSSTTVPQISNDTTSDLDSSYLSCSMTNSKHPLKITVLLGGGVDSSVTLRLLHAEDFQNFWSECPWEEDLKYAKAVCNQVDVALEVVHMTNEYWDKVVSYIIDEYKCGCTPNHDVLCNTRIKFGAFMDAISNMDFEFVASGYVNLLEDILVKKKVRQGLLFYDCSLHIEEKDGFGTVQLPEDDQGLAASQFVAFYQQELCVGSGVILESWDDAKGFPVSVSNKARHIAKMEDKSKLGKPIMIKQKTQDCLTDSIC